MRGRDKYEKRFLLVEKSSSVQEIELQNPYSGVHPYPPKKADFGREKAKMGCFSQKGVCYSFGILHGLISNKIMKIPMKQEFLGPPLPP